MKANWGWYLEVAADQVEHLVGYRATPSSPGPWVNCLCRSNLVLGMRLLLVRRHRRSSSWLDENLLVVVVDEIVWVFQTHCSNGSSGSWMSGLWVDIPWKISKSSDLGS